jgi:hypothetical protein
MGTQYPHRVGIALLLACSCCVARPETVGPIERVEPPVQGFYSKRTVVRGVSILAHADVSNAALEEAGRRMARQLARAPEIAENLQALGAELHIIGKDQEVSDLPEYRHMKGKPFAGAQTIDQRGRGYGGLHASCSEENLLLLPKDRFDDHRDICSHEFAHTIYGYGLSQDIRAKWEAQFRKSLDAGRWKTMYAATNDDEFFAELTMWYFGSRGDYGKLKPPPERGVLWLKSYDPDACALLDAIYSGELKPKRSEVVDLPPLPVEQEGKLRSQQNQPATSVFFLNRTDKPVKMFWLDFDGKRKPYGEIVPGACFSQRTYLTHAWLLEDAGGKCLGIYLPEKASGRVVIGGEPPKAKPDATVPAKESPFDPTSAYREQRVEGWRVLVNEKLLADAELAKGALAELTRQLYQCNRSLPAQAREKLKNVTFWMELANPKVAGGCYHPSEGWLRNNGFNPEKAKGIEFGNAKNLIGWARQQPYMALHELAHAYHHQVLGYNQPELKAAFKRMVESKTYENVLNYDNKTVKHYALNNDMEYFAESSEAYFGTNDFYPFVRAELKAHDPEMFKLVGELWTNPKAATPKKDE